VVDQLRARGEKVGQIRLRLWRPFPFEELRNAVKHVKGIIVLDRAISYGGPGGPVAGEIRAALYSEKNKPLVTNFVAGLAGRDVTVNDYIDMYEKTQKLTGSRVRQEDYTIYGVRE
jgi:pyruvate ferredoxin oxidoreductase alpha subunit